MLPTFSILMQLLYNMSPSKTAFAMVKSPIYIGNSTKQLNLSYHPICYCRSASQGTPPVNRKNLMDYPPPRNEYRIHHHLLLGYYLHNSD